MSAPASTNANPLMQRLGKNLGKYLGERIGIERVLDDVEFAAKDRGWKTDLLSIERGSSRLLGLTRYTANPNRRVYISAGIHGDEPAGPLAVLKLLQEDRWPAGTDVWICPCLNPTGFPLSSRENADGVDLNRQYREPKAEETRAHIAWLDRQPRFDVSLCLHEDWEAQGFYLYELNPDAKPSFAESMISLVAQVCPIDTSLLIEGREASNGIIRTSIDPRSRPDWPEAFHLITYKTRLSYTLEAPSDFQMAARVAALVAGVRTVLDGVGMADGTADGKSSDDK
jgi:protein MpaA